MFCDVKIAMATQPPTPETCASPELVFLCCPKLWDVGVALCWKGHCSMGIKCNMTLRPRSSNHITTYESRCMISGAHQSGCVVQWLHHQLRSSQEFRVLGLWWWSWWVQLWGQSRSTSRKYIGDSLGPAQTHKSAAHYSSNVHILHMQVLKANFTLMRLDFWEIESARDFKCIVQIWNSRSF